MRFRALRDGQCKWYIVERIIETRAACDIHYERLLATDMGKADADLVVAMLNKYSTRGGTRLSEHQPEDKS